MGPILGRLSPVARELRAAIVRAHATGEPVPGLNRKQQRLIALMRWAARTVLNRLGEVDSADVARDLQYRIVQVKKITKLIKTLDSPPLSTMLALAAQPEHLATALTGRVSDTLVTQHTAQQQAKCGSGEVLIWEPERDACVRCLKYAGRFRAADDTFQAGLSFDPNAPKPDPKDRIPGPPLHSHCRCNLTPVKMSAARDNAQALKREAERSVLKGWALDSESNAARERAARDLLANNVIAPKSVIAETRKRLKADEPFIRDVP